MEKNTVVIELTGDYAKDLVSANREGGFVGQPDGYVWHHTEKVWKDNDGKIYGELQLVLDAAHTSAIHKGGVDLYRKLTGEVGYL